MNRLAAAGAALVSMLLAACGGNGTPSGDGPTPSAVPSVTPTPHLLIGVAATPDAERGIVRITAWVRHDAGPPVQFVDCCTGSGVVEPIELELVDPPVRLLFDDAEYPCGPPRLCPGGFRELPPGGVEGYLERTLEFDGTVWMPEHPRQEPRNACDELLANSDPVPRCAEMQLAPGRYTLRARFSYCGNRAEQISESVETVTTLEWR